MGHTHAAILLVIGFFGIMIPLVGFYILTGLWDGWLMVSLNTFNTMEIAAAMLGYTFMFALVFWPIIGFWADLVFTAYGSADDE